MIRDGHKFRRSWHMWMERQIPKEARVPHKCFNGSDIAAHDVVFYKVSRRPFPGAKMFSRAEEEQIWCKPVPTTGSSLTNMAHGLLEHEQGRFYRKLYLAVDGKCYTSRIYYDAMTYDQIAERWPAEYKRLRVK